MSDIIIIVERLSKEYRLGQIGATTLRDSFERWRNRLSGNQPTDDSVLWALKDVSFEVKRGEVLGIIGRNGAGKSTLLKILSRITRPTSGRAIMRGRVASLLEVGTGFHPELTGRENIYLNGAILGMKKAEIVSKFDEMVAFAEVEKFVDTPVKRYSSGMYVRLAFAVAAHLDPEILIIDEVLAVGDASFQKKCVGKMGEVAREGRTVLLVSHNMPMVMNLCGRAILLRAGEVVLDAPPARTVESYLASVRSGAGEMVWPDRATAPGDNSVRLCSVRVCQDGIDGPTADVDMSKEVRIEATYLCLKDGEKLYGAMVLKDNMGMPIFASSNMTSISLTVDSWFSRSYERGVFRWICRIPPFFLNELVYTVTPILGRQPNETIVREEDAVSFEAHDTGEMRQEFYGGWAGVIRPKLVWQTEKLSN